MSDLHIAIVLIKLANLVKERDLSTSKANSNHEKWSWNKLLFANYQFEY